ncbi:MAG: DCC1-like thiol-disulfide oxidoreductase family protein [Henriciella sp.]|uniref:thiol-disulfide oxidoreductase DCC family protein n=1 Tax=Henriciella sp. TaxID=1968823 RepID=UPI0032EC8982
MIRPDSDLIVFDGECVFCSSFARFVATHDKARKFAFVASQSATGRALCVAHGINPDDPESNIVRVDGQAYLKFRAFTKVMTELGWPWKALGVLSLIPRPAANWVYDRIAKNRYVFGRSHCILPSPELKARLIE